MPSFLEKARATHSDKYDYSKVAFTRLSAKVIIACPKHGDYIQEANSHLQGHGCPSCGLESRVAKRKHSQASFESAAKRIHGDKYGYQSTAYKTGSQRVEIRCPHHGVFAQRAADHLKGTGCPACARRELKQCQPMSSEEFVTKARCKHSNRYDYSAVAYVKSSENVAVICKQHGEFWQQAGAHLRGSGCPKCALSARTQCCAKTTEDFIKAATVQHADRYDYSAIEYKLSKEKVAVICRKHGVFHQEAGSHMRGIGCPACAASSFSRPALEWLQRCAQIDGTHIQHAGNGGEVSIRLADGSKVKPDGFSKELNKVYEFHGSFWHGEPRIYEPDDINPVNKKTMGDLHQKTLRRTAAMRAAGYIVEEMWEMDFKDCPKQRKDLSNNV